eukprot:TRINITY_DN681_c0_g1_i1.p1 TRINITY_DN681_c0_g1~~TRINITY_DN681_c0_g1_i1.p1  ORF type:complete len:1518 (+),score=303.17 TRINITY_DN681_c0_g1_i1:420-4973(+)
MAPPPPPPPQPGAQSRDSLANLSSGALSMDSLKSGRRERGSRRSSLTPLEMTRRLSITGTDASLTQSKAEIGEIEPYWRVSKEAKDRWNRALARVRVMVMFSKFRKKEEEENTDIAQEVHESEPEEWVFDTDSRFFGIWGLVVLVVILYNFGHGPILWAYDPHKLWVWFVLEYIGDIILWVDIGLRFYTPLQDGAQLISSRREIRQKLFRSPSFFLDVVTVIPIDIILFAAGAYRAGIYYRLVRLWWCHHIDRLYTFWERRTFISPLVFKLLKMGLYIVMIAHVVACAWFKVGFHENFSHSRNWLTEDNIINAGASTQYVRSLYWSVSTLTTVGYGDIVPMTDGETVFTVLVMLIGQSVYAYIIGTIATVLQGKDKLNADFKKKMDELRVWIRWRQLPPDLSRRLVRFYEYLWGVNRGIDEEALLEELPQGLRNEVAYFLNEDTLRSVPIFKSTDQHFISLLAVKLKPLIVGPEDFIIRYGDMGSQMYLMRKGQVQVLSPDMTVEYARLGPGTFFGEIALLRSERRTANIRAITYCELFTLDKDDLADILSDFPEYRERIYKVAAERERKMAEKNNSTNRSSARDSVDGPSTQATPDVKRRVDQAISPGAGGSTVPVVHTAAEVMTPGSILGGGRNSPTPGIEMTPLTSAGAMGDRGDHGQDSDQDDGGTSLVQDEGGHSPHSTTPGHSPAAAVPSAAHQSTDSLPPIAAHHQARLSRANPFSSSLPHLLSPLDAASPSNTQAQQGRTSQPASPRGLAARRAHLGMEDDSYLVKRSGSKLKLAPITHSKSGIYSELSPPLPGVPHSNSFIERQRSSDLPTSPSPQWKKVSTFARVVGAHVATAKRAGEYREKEANQASAVTLDPEDMPWYKRAILPENSYYQLWDLCLLFGILYNAFIVPVRIAYGLRQEPVIFAMDYIWDVLFWIGIPVQFRVALSQRGIIQRDLTAIRRSYLRGWFAWDILSILPLDLFLMATGDYQVVAIARLLRLIRVAKVPRKFSNWEKQAKINAILIRVCRLSFWIVLMAHWSGTVWFLIGDAEGKRTNTSWTLDDGLENATVGMKWSRSLYWAVTTLTTVGYGDIKPFTEGETIYAIVMMLAGQSLYAFIIGTMSTLVANADALGTDFQRKVERVSAYMRWRNLPAMLRDKINRYLDYLWFINKGIDEQNVLGHLSGSLRTDISLLLNRDVVRSVPIFKDCADSFINLLVTNLKSKIVAPGDYIIRKGDQGKEVFILRLGVVEVVVNSRVVATLHAPTYFGEAALLTKEKRNASIRSKTYCEVFVLDQTDFDRILEDFPGYRERMLYISLKRQAKNAAASDSESDFDDEAFEGHDHSSFGTPSEHAGGMYGPDADDFVHDEMGIMSDSHRQQHHHDDSSASGGGSKLSRTPADASTLSDHDHSLSMRREGSHARKGRKGAPKRRDPRYLAASGHLNVPGRLASSTEHAGSGSMPKSIRMSRSMDNISRLAKKQAVKSSQASASRPVSPVSHYSQSMESSALPPPPGQTISTDPTLAQLLS